MPPVIAESRDPFAGLRIVDRLNATYQDWLFEPRVVADALIQLQSNWLADYRNTSGIVIEDGPEGAVLTIEDTSRVDPWIVRQAQRLAEACGEELLEFSRRAPVKMSTPADGDSMTATGSAVR